MSNITAADVKKLRDLTQAGMMDCKEALAEAGGDIEKAQDLLRARRKTIADKKGATRETGHGVVGTYTHMGGRIGTMVELRCETDFVARNDEFAGLLKDLCLHVAAASPLVVRREDLDPAVIEKEREVFTMQAREQGLPEDKISHIVEGMMEKNFFKQQVLLEQAFVKDTDTTVGDLVKDVSGKTGEKIEVKRIARFEA